VCAACLKNFVRKFVGKNIKWGFLEGSGVPVLYIGRKVPKGVVLHSIQLLNSDHFTPIMGAMNSICGPNEWPEIDKLMKLNKEGVNNRYFFIQIS
jgi:hypothetical protein